jgi:hypothetical protein
MLIGHEPFDLLQTAGLPDLAAVRSDQGDGWYQRHVDGNRD